MTCDFLISNIEPSVFLNENIGICDLCDTIINNNYKKTNNCNSCKKFCKTNKSSAVIFEIKSMIRDFFASNPGKKSVNTFEKLEVFFKELVINSPICQYHKENCCWYFQYHEEIHLQIQNICQQIIIQFAKVFLHKTPYEELHNFSNAYRNINFDSYKMIHVVHEKFCGEYSKLPAFHMNRKIFIDNVGVDLTFFDNLD